jgi:putative heme iron utilization protein
VSTAGFAPEVVAAVCDHMNGDHPDDCRLIVAGLGGRPDVVAARMTGLDHDAACFHAVLPDGSSAEVRVPFSAPVLERAQIRVEVVRMYDDACAAMGVDPRAEGEH